MRDRANRLDRILIVALAALAITTSGRTRAQEQTAPTGTANIAGRVTDATDGHPLSGVQVHISTVNNARRVSQDATTAADGRYAVVNVPAGQVDIRTSVSGYANGLFGQRRLTGDHVFLRLAAGDRVDDADVRMWRYAKISGTVRDEHGKPAAGVKVLAQARVTHGTASGYGGTATADAMGAYHLDVIEGDYVLRVLASARNMPIPLSAGTATPNATRGSSSSLLVVDNEGRNFVEFTGPRPADAPPAKNATMYVTSYFGGSDNMARATPVVVKSGEVRDGLDFALIARPVVRVTGIVTGPNGRVPGAMVRLLADEPSSSNSPWDVISVLSVAQALCDGEGRFTFMAAPSGEYTLDASRPFPPMGAMTISSSGLPQLMQHDYSSGDPEGYTGGLPISIGHDDMTGIEIVMRSTIGPQAGGVRVTGTLTFEHPPFKIETPWVTFAVLLEGIKGSAASSSMPPAGGRFAIENVAPGTYELRIGPGVMGWSIVSVMSHGRELSTPITIGADGLSDLAILLGERTNTVSGHVIDSDGRVIRDAGLVLFPVNPDARIVIKTREPRVRYTRADATTYTIADIPDGDYFVAAIDDALMDGWPDAALLSKIAAVASRVSVRNGAHVSQDLKFISALR